MIKKLTYVLGIAALLFGLWGFYNRFAVGDTSAAFGSFVVWGLWVALYFFFGGLAIGAFFIASLDYLFNVPAFKGTGKTALWASLVSLAAGLAAIGLDLGHMERLIEAYLQPNFSSGVVEDVWGYTIFGVLALIALIMALRNSTGTAHKIVMALGFAVALFVAGAPGKLLGVNAGRLFWHAGMLPVQFIFFAVTTGVALMLLIKGFFGKADEQTGKLFSVLGVASIVLTVINLYFVWLYFSQSLAGGSAALVAPITEITSGKYSTLFWWVQIIAGSIIPVLVFALPKLAKINVLAGLMGLFMLVGNLAARYLILIPPQEMEPIEGLAEAFSGYGYTLAYIPTPVEWAVSAGLAGIVILGLLLGADVILPLVSKPQKEV